MKRQHKSKGEVTIYAECGDFVRCIDSAGEYFDCPYADLLPGVVATGMGELVSLFPNTSESQSTARPQQIQLEINSVTGSELYKAFRGIGRTNANHIVANKPSGGYRTWQQLEKINPNVPKETWDALRADGAFAFN